MTPFSKTQNATPYAFKWLVWLSSMGTKIRAPHATLTRANPTRLNNPLRIQSMSPKVQPIDVPGQNGASSPEMGSSFIFDGKVLVTGAPKAWLGCIAPPAMPKSPKVS